MSSFPFFQMNFTLREMLLSLKPHEWIMLMLFELTAVLYVLQITYFLHLTQLITIWSCQRGLRWRAGLLISDKCPCSLYQSLKSTHQRYTHTHTHANTHILSKNLLSLTAFRCAIHHAHQSLSLIRWKLTLLQITAHSYRIRWNNKSLPLCIKAIHLK